MSHFLMPVVSVLLVIGSIAPWSILSAAQPTGSSVHVSLTALQLPGGVRYSVVLLNPSDPGLNDVRVQTRLPEGSEVLQALETPGRTQFLGLDANILSWSAPFISASSEEVVDAFSFVLARPLTAEAQVRVTWSVGSTEINARPEPVVAIATGGEMVVGPNGSGSGFLPIGDTGVQVRIEPGSIPEGTVLSFARLGPETNPPGDDALWWCAALTVDGLPSGAWILVLAPTRQPLPPNAAVALSAERDGTWEELDQMGIATSDSQFVAFVHHGGTIAAGVQIPLQPSPINSAFLQSNPTVRAVEGLRAAPTPTPVGHPQLEVSITGNTTVRQNDLTSHTVTVRNVGTAAARDVYIDTTSSLLPINFLSSDQVASCYLAPPRTGRVAMCLRQSIAAGSSFTVTFSGVGSGSQNTNLPASITVRARDNKTTFETGTATTTDAAVLTIVVNPT